MARVFEDTVGKIRDKPIAETLKLILAEAGDAVGIDLVRVTSGGQAKLGTPGKRTGSTRHDLGNAADLMIERGGRALAFNVPTDLPSFERFVEVAAEKGATGIGAGAGYMGVQTIHVGFGSEAVWGDGGRGVNTPPWLRQAFSQGRAGAGARRPAVRVPLTHASPAHVVIARSGLRLRTGPGPDFGTRAVLAQGTKVVAVPDETDPRWARIDLEGDGLFDGYAFAAFLAPA
jgi:hypothetical protein